MFSVTPEIGLNDKKNHHVMKFVCKRHLRSHLQAIWAFKGTWKAFKFVDCEFPYRWDQF